MTQEQIQQAAFDEALVSTDDRLSLCYNAFLITADILELENKKFKIGVELFHEILCICPRVPDKENLLMIHLEQASEVDKEVVERQKKKKMKGIAIDAAAQELLHIKKGIRKSREDYILQQIPKGSSEGSGTKPEVLNEPKGKSKGLSKRVGITPKVPDEPKGKFVAQDDDWGSDEVMMKELNQKEKWAVGAGGCGGARGSRRRGLRDDGSSAREDDDERTESKREVAESEKSDEVTVDDEEVHLDEEVHSEEEEQIDDDHYDEEVHDDEYLHDDVEKHDDADEKINDAEKADEIKDDQEMANAEKIDSKKTKEETIDNEQNEKPELPPSTSSLSLSSDYALYDALVQSLLVDEDDMDRGVVEPHTQKRRRHDDEGQDPPPDCEKEQKKQRIKDAEPPKKSYTSKESSKVKTPPKTSKTDKSVTAEESVEEPIHEAAIDVEEPIQDDVVNDADQPQEDVDPKKDNFTWFKQPPRPETLIQNGTKTRVLMMDWRRLGLMIWLILRKIHSPLMSLCPLPLTSRSHLTIPVDFFFNNDLEYLKTETSKRIYTSSITKAKAAKHEMKFIEEMIPR
ncbi:hypothetical protein Tco_0779469 [Tanacetum coccineum]